MTTTQSDVTSEHLTFPFTLVVQPVALHHTVGTIRGIRSVLSDGIRGGWGNQGEGGCLQDRLF